MLKKYIFCLFLLFITLCILNADETLVITEEGNVGIGVDNPEEQLEVTGNMRVNGNITAGWFTPLPISDDIVFYDLSTGADDHELPNAETYTGLHIVMWKGGNRTTKILTFQPFSGTEQTIDEKSASTWKGEGNGKIILAPYDFDPAPETTDINWVAVDYIDSGSDSGAFFQKFADGTMRQWGKQDGTSPIEVNYLLDFHDYNTADYSGESVVTVGSPAGGCYTTNGIPNYTPGVSTCEVYIRTRTSGEDYQYEATGHWIAFGRWY